jgi:L-aminopeptidase/D-esterase-like protein
VIQALEAARGGPVEAGSVGGGTGMIAYDFKGGNGTASRIVKIAGRLYTLGAFVQSNFGQRPECTILGVPVGLHITGDELRGKAQGSIIVIIATDAPLEAHQLKRIARRVPLGLARTGTVGHNSSGDIFLAFSTANEEAFTARRGELRRMEAISTGDIDPLFAATVEATEEAIIDSMIANQTMVGRDGNRSIALPHDRLIDVMRKHGRM